MVAISNCAGISAPFLFPATTAPMYSMGNWTMFAFLVVSVGTSLYAWHMFGSHSGYRGYSPRSKDEEGSQVKVIDPESPLSSSASSATFGVEVVKQIDEKEVIEEVAPVTP